MNNISFPSLVFLRRMVRTGVILTALLAPLALMSPAAQAAGGKTYSENEVLKAAGTFFGVTSKALADVAGIGVNYQQSGRTVLAPIRTGVGFRAGGNAGHLYYTRQSSWFPL